jgi:hypothetical protein
LALQLFFGDQFSFHKRCARSNQLSGLLPACQFSGRFNALVFAGCLEICGQLAVVRRARARRQ